MAAVAEAVGAESWSEEQQALWRRIRAHVLDDPDAPLCFSRRLARDNHWSTMFAEGVIEEYRRFVLLAMVAGHPVTPSDQVDQAWHLHLLYTRDYWGAFTALLPRPLHHGPTRGGAAEGRKYADWYSKTLHSYWRVFGEHPSMDIWPPLVERFGRDLHWLRINGDDYWLVPRPRRLWTLVRRLLS
ncbi:hypothetical protein CKO23_22865 [Thiocystis violacea]|nr:hypothetical protein [Thiocystis violacea]